MLAQFPAITAFFHAAKRQTWIAFYQFVYKNSTFIKLESKFFRFLNILCKKRNAQSKSGIIGKPNRFLHRFESCNRKHRSEGLLVKNKIGRASCRERVKSKEVTRS